ncbi:RHS repeat-associated core domain-containing protein [Porticoccus sp. W117]|uniref:RHS repeat-associated core domain-containing protein n=1 Tax=Porticoccus sp. W117 TaxID=3054777 RepID=UPI002592510A|nr:RHS repeat-associated core domain-containing protein [Porticoccus sp. W117]MDM3872258.1 RHS repeat-associated core domain-containing protein [Porticoccus sp. W117]
MYDAKIARFLQADPFIQDPLMSQSLNRYAYVWNNPLNATDPSGYFVGAVIGHLIGSELTRRFIQSSWIGKNVIQPALQYVSRKPLLNAIVTVVIAYYGGPSAVAAYSEAVTYANGGSLLDGVKAGAISYAQSFVFAQIGASGLETTERIFAHAVAGGVFSELQGGKFGHGFVSAGLTKAFTTYANFDYSDGSAKAVIGRTAVAAMVGGTISELTGGKFANGATTAAIAHLFNAELSESEKRAIRARNKKAIEQLYGDILKAGNINIDANIRLAASMTLDQLKSALTDASVWNYKRNSSLIANLKAAGTYDANLLAEFGNLHAGITYAANGVRLDVALTFGGGYQSAVQNRRNGNFSGGAVGSTLSGALSAWVGYTATAKQTISAARNGFTWGDNRDDILPIIQGYCAVSLDCN